MKIEKIIESLFVEDEGKDLSDEIIRKVSSMFKSSMVKIYNDSFGKGVSLVNGSGTVFWKPISIQQKDKFSYNVQVGAVIGEFSKKTITTRFSIGHQHLDAAVDLILAYLKKQASYIGKPMNKQGTADSKDLEKKLNQMSFYS